MSKKNLGNLMKQAQQMQNKINMLQKELNDREIEVSVGGAIKVKVTGKPNLVGIKINFDEVDLEDKAGFEELLVTAINKGLEDSQKMVSDSMSKVTGGLHIPGLF